jgi:hypothetical protein
VTRLKSEFGIRMTGLLDESLGDFAQPRIALIDWAFLLYKVGPSGADGALKALRSNWPKGTDHLP